MFSLFEYFAVSETFWLIFFDSLFHFFGCEVQVAIADPLYLKPVPVVGITTALELNL